MAAAAAAAATATAATVLPPVPLPSVADVLDAAVARGMTSGMTVTSSCDLMADKWREAQVWERAWWTTARDQHATEVAKSARVAELLGVSRGTAASVLDVGCGPLSLLLRVPHGAGSAALDPLHFGDDLEAPYGAAGVRRIVKRGEDLRAAADGTWDEVWVYNCLQHVEDPLAVLTAAMGVATRCVRVFEWTHIPPYRGHLHELTPELLATPFFAEAWHPALTTTGWFDDDDSNLHGNFYCGVFTRRT